MACASELPEGAFFNVDPLQFPGTYDASSYTTGLPDQSGNGRDFVIAGIFSAPASSDLYPVAGGTQRLPVLDFLYDRMEYLEGSAVPLTSFSLLSWGFHDEPLTSTGPLGPMFGPAFPAGFRTRWTSTTGTDGQLVLAQSGTTYEIPGCTPVAFPQRGGPSAAGSDTAWWIQWVNRSVEVTTGVSTWTWILVGDLDDGNGLRVLTDQTWQEGESYYEDAAGEFQNYLDGTSAWYLQAATGYKEAGGAAFWTSSLDDDVGRRGMVWASEKFDGEVCEAVTALIDAGQPLRVRLREKAKHWMEDERAEGAEPYIAAMAAPSALARQALEEYILNFRPGKAAGELLRLKAENMGYKVFEGESDSRVRARIMAYGEAVVEDYVGDAVQDILSDEGLPAAVFYPWYDGPFYLDPTDVDFGFFLDNSRLPVARGVVIEVDSSTPDEVVATLVHILNEKMAFGFFWAIVLV